MLPELLKNVQSSPELLKEIYGDLAKPGVQQVGRALETVIGLGNTMLWPVALLNEKAKLTLQKNLDDYREKLAKIPEEDVCPVNPEIGVPIAEKLSYVSDDELRELYLELLAKASSSKTSGQAHPSFVNIIDNLSPDEALLGHYLKKHTRVPILEVRLDFERGQSGWSLLSSHFTDLDENKGLIFKENIDAYISNFEGLGIISIKKNQWIKPEDIYNELENKAKAKFDLHKQISNFSTSQLDQIAPNLPMPAEQFLTSLKERKLSFVKGRIDVTAFGKLFFSSVVTDDEPKKV